MRLFALEHTRVAYLADFVFYGLAIPALAVIAVAIGPRERLPELAGLALLGLAGWTLIEYVIHRFLLHGIPPFSRWHAEHHDRPAALISSPTYFTALLFSTLVFLPTEYLGDLSRACALTSGVLAGFLAFSITHHAVHHWRASGAWLDERKRLHALHHHKETGGPYGVTTAFWDIVFGSIRRRAQMPRA